MGEVVKRNSRKQDLLYAFLLPSLQMFPAVISTKLEAAIEREEERKRQMRLAEQGKGRPGGKKAGKSASEFELLLNEYSKIEAEEIAVGAFPPLTLSQPLTEMQPSTSIAFRGKILLRHEASPSWGADRSHEDKQRSFLHVCVYLRLWRTNILKTWKTNT